jgi:hypothetical protein
MSNNLSYQFNGTLKEEIEFIKNEMIKKFVEEGTIDKTSIEYVECIKKLNSAKTVKTVKEAVGLLKIKRYTKKEYEKYMEKIINDINSSKFVTGSVVSYDEDDNIIKMEKFGS